jgi:hypothetical protein
MWGWVGLYGRPLWVAEDVGSPMNGPSPPTPGRP